MAPPTPIHPETRIGHVHLKVADLERALGLYRDVLGFEVTRRMALGMLAAGVLLALAGCGGPGRQLRGGRSPVDPFSEHEPRVMREMTEALLDHGAEIGLRNEDGATALAIAAVLGPLGVVRRLLSALERDEADVVRDARATAFEARNLPAVAQFDGWLARQGF